MTRHRQCGCAAGPEPRDRNAAEGRGSRDLIDSLRVQLGGELAASHQGLAECTLEVDRLRERLADLQREHRRLCDDYAALEGRIAELGNLCVLMERLHGTLDHREVLAGVQDVIINVIGSEELAIFEPSEDGRWLSPTQSFGVEDRHLGRVPWGEGPIGRAAAEGMGWVVGGGAAPPEFPDLTACVPLAAGDRLAGVLVIWRMLAHKPVFGEADRNVLEHVARHAATALLLTSASEGGRRQPPRSLETAP
jgi:GAF domain